MMHPWLLEFFLFEMTAQEEGKNNPHSSVDVSKNMGARTTGNDRGMCWTADFFCLF